MTIKSETQIIWETFNNNPTLGLKDIMQLLHITKIQNIGVKIQALVRRGQLVSTMPLSNNFKVVGPVYMTPTDFDNWKKNIVIIKPYTTEEKEKIMETKTEEAKQEAKAEVNTNDFILQEKDLAAVKQLQEILGRSLGFNPTIEQTMSHCVQAMHKHYMMGQSSYAGMFTNVQPPFNQQPRQYGNQPAPEGYGIPAHSYGGGAKG